jgi:hypothetical protein
MLNDIKQIIKDWIETRKNVKKIEKILDSVDKIEYNIIRKLRKEGKL